MPHTIVALIPCYNVACFCEKVVRDATYVCTYVIAVDDGSKDQTGKNLHQLSLEFPNKVHVITFLENQGKGFALLEGFRYAINHFKFDVLVTLDGDGQHVAHLITDLAQPVFKGADFVIGARSFNQMPLRNRCANRIITFLLRCIYRRAPHDTQSGMRAFSWDMVREFTSLVKGGHYEMEFRCLLLALEKKKKIVEVPIPTIYINKNKSSHFLIFKDSFEILRVLATYLKNRSV